VGHEIESIWKTREGAEQRALLIRGALKEGINKYPYMAKLAGPMTLEVKGYPVGDA
jgi:hypothetical protein